MTKDQLQKLYEDLEEEEKSLREQLGGVATQNPTIKGDYQVKVPDYGDEDDENAMEVTDLEKNIVLEQELESRLREIEKTKQKIKEGTYGKCENCSVEIPEARLKVKPVAALCINCAKLGKNI